MCLGGGLTVRRTARFAHPRPGLLPPHGLYALYLAFILHARPHIRYQVYFRLRAKSKKSPGSPPGGLWDAFPGVQPSTPRESVPVTDELEHYLELVSVAPQPDA